MSIAIKLDIKRGDFQLQLDTELPAEGVTAIYGHSGAGKTTLLRFLAGLDNSIHGQLHFGENCWQDKLSFTPAHQRKVGYVFQDARLFPHLSVRGNLHYAWYRRFQNNGPSIEQASDWLDLNTLLDRSPLTLSGGQQQRVAIARALLSAPQLILMDEPLGSLDTAAKEKILYYLERLQRHLNIPMIYVSHNIDEVSRLADYLLILENGGLVASGPLLELCSRLDLPINHEEHAASIISASINNHDTHYQLSELLVDQQHTLFLTHSDANIGDKLRVRIPARDVSITLDKPTNSSILNIIPCTVDAIEQSTGARKLVRLKLADQYLLARLTHKSVDRLQLHCGQAVYAQIKSVALLNDNQQSKHHEQ